MIIHGRVNTDPRNHPRAGNSQYGVPNGPSLGTTRTLITWYLDSVLTESIFETRIRRGVGGGTAGGVIRGLNGVSRKLMRVVVSSLANMGGTSLEIKVSSIIIWEPKVEIGGLGFIKVKLRRFSLQVEMNEVSAANTFQGGNRI